MQTSDPDVRRMLAFRDGDDAALAELYRRWAGPLVRFLDRLVAERATAEELMQETFVRVHSARSRYVPEARFSTWLFRIARNLALNELERSRNKAPHASTDEAVAEGSEATARPGPTLTLVAGGAPVDDLADARREHRRVTDALAALPERQRAALWLAAVEGHSYAEIAETLETSAASVKALVHRARVGLADRLATDDTERADSGGATISEDAAERDAKRAAAVEGEKGVDA